MSSSFLPLLFSLPVIIISFAPKTVVKSDPDLGFVSCLCGRQRDADPPRMKTRAIQVTVSAVKNTVPTFAGFCDAMTPEPAMYVYAMCPTGVTPEDCTRCLEYAQDKLINNLCKDLYGAHLVLHGCILRYETYKFC